MRSPIPLLAAAVFAACASGGIPTATPLSPAGLSRLEARVARGGADVDAEVKLAAAYRALHRPQDAGARAAQPAPTQRRR